MKITAKNLDRAWNRALLILHDTHKPLAQAMEGQEPELEGQTIIFTCGMTIAERQSIRLAIREAYGELGADVASIIRADPAWPAVEPIAFESISYAETRPEGTGRVWTTSKFEPETRVSDEAERAEGEMTKLAAEGRLDGLRRMSQWLKVKGEVEKAFADGADPVAFADALREFLEEPTDWRERLPILIHSAIDRSLTPADHE